jgi:hypothetical protein
MSASGIFFLAGDPAQPQSVEEGVNFRFEDVRSVFYELTGRAPTKPLTLTLNFRSHAGILEAAGVLLEWLLKYFPGSCKKLRQDDGLCSGPCPGWAMPVSHTDLAEPAWSFSPQTKACPSSKRIYINVQLAVVSRICVESKLEKE